MRSRTGDHRHQSDLHQLRKCLPIAGKLGALSLPVPITWSWTMRAISVVRWSVRRGHARHRVAVFTGLRAQF